MNDLRISANYDSDGAVSGITIHLPGPASPQQIQEAMRMLLRAGRPPAPYPDADPAPASTHVLNMGSHEADPLDPQTKLNNAWTY